MAIADAMRLLWVGGLADCIGLRSWSTDKLFSPSQMTVTTVTNSDFVVYLGNAKQTQSYFSHEADRFASAAFESLLAGPRNPAYPRATGWQIIRCYYAAYFAVHALMRLHGWACTRLTTANLRSINNDIKTLFVGSDKRDAGLYLIKCESGGREIRCKHLGTSLGGSHEALWALLPSYLEETESILLTAPNSDIDESVLVAAIDIFSELVKKHGGVDWFPKVRNRVNYSHGYGTWFPYQNSTCDYDRIDDVLRKWKSRQTKFYQHLDKTSS